jgi:hypothetical protein
MAELPLRRWTILFFSQKRPVQMNNIIFRRATGLLLLAGLLIALAYRAASDRFVLAQAGGAAQVGQTIPTVVILEQESAEQTITVPVGSSSEPRWLVIYAANPISPTLGPLSFAISSIVTWQWLDRDFLNSSVVAGDASIKLPPPGRTVCSSPQATDVDPSTPPLDQPLWFSPRFFHQSRAELEMLPSSPLSDENRLALIQFCTRNESPFSLGDELDFLTGETATLIKYVALPSPTPTLTATEAPTEVPAPDTPTPTPTPPPTATPFATVNIEAIILTAQAAVGGAQLAPEAIETLAARLHEQEAERQAELERQIALLHEEFQHVIERVDVALAPTPLPPPTATPNATLTTVAEAKFAEAVALTVLARLPTPQPLILERRLTIPEQTGDGRFVTVTDLAIDEASWLVIYHGDDTSSATPLGLSYVLPGSYDFYEVGLTAPPTPGPLRAALFADRGKQGRFEAGIDPPLSHALGSSEPLQAAFSVVAPLEIAVSTPVTTPTMTPTPTQTPGPPLDSLRISFPNVGGKRGCGDKDAIKQPVVVWGREVVHIDYPANLNINDYLAAYRFELVAIPDGVNVQFGAERPSSAVSLLDAEKNEALLRNRAYTITSPETYKGILTKDVIYQLAIVASDKSGLTHLQTDGNCFFKLNSDLY